MLLHIMKADELSPRRAADTELGPGGLQQEDVGSPSGVRAYGQGAQAWVGAWEGHVRGADNHLLNSSLPTKPGFQATSSRQLSRVPPALSSSVLLPLRDAPKAPHLQSHIIWRHTHWVSPRGRGRGLPRHWPRAQQCTVNAAGSTWGPPAGVRRNCPQPTRTRGSVRSRATLPPS